MIRNMEEGDLDWAADLDARLFGSLSWPKEALLEAFLPGRRFFVREEGGKPVGWAASDMSLTKAHLLSLDVEPLLWGRGIGSGLLSSVISSAKSLGKAKCILEASRNNLRALGLYKKFGFGVKGEIKNYYPSSDALIMEKDLD